MVSPVFWELGSNHNSETYADGSAWIRSKSTRHWPPSQQYVFVDINTSTSEFGDSAVILETRDYLKEVDSSSDLRLRAIKLQSRSATRGTLSLYSSLERSNLLSSALLFH